MNLLNWRKEMSLGLEDIDRQHYMFFEILGRLHEAAVFESHLSVLKGLAGDLCCYASLLFRGEENFLALMHDPDACGHLLEHSEFRHLVTRLEDVNVLADRQAVRTIAEELGDWLEKHIHRFDHSLALRVRPTLDASTLLKPARAVDLTWMCEPIAS